MAQLVAAAGRNHLYPMTCLRQSLILQRLLGRYGIESTLRIGVRKEGGDLHAHAWLEREGEVLDPSRDLPGFLPLRPPSKAGAGRGRDAEREPGDEDSNGPDGSVGSSIESS